MNQESIEIKNFRNLGGKRAKSWGTGKELRNEIAPHFKSLSEIIEIEFFFVHENNLASTNQTSFEISLDELSSSIRENKKNFGNERENMRKFETGVVKNTSLGTLKKKKKQELIKKNKYLPREKYVIRENQSFGVEKKRTMKSSGERKSLKLEQSRNRKKKIFVPVLSLKNMKKNIESGRNSNNSSHLKLVTTANTEKKIIIESVQVKLAEPEKKRPSTAFSSPLRNVKKYTNPLSLPENPYMNSEILPSLQKVLEEVQRKLIFTDSSSQDSNDSINSLFISQSHKQKQPSFGMGGGEFLNHQEFLEKPQENLIHYKLNPAIPISQTTQTDELFSLINDRDFIESLKIIGKFAGFFEKNVKK